MAGDVMIVLPEGMVVLRNEVVDVANVSLTPWYWHYVATGVEPLIEYLNAMRSEGVEMRVDRLMSV